VRRLLAVSVLATQFLLAAESARAAIITYNFTGTVTQNLNNPYGVTAGVGTAVSGSFTYDTGALDTYPPSGQGQYAQPVPPADLSILFSATGDVAVADILMGTVVQDSTNDFFQIYANSNVGSVNSSPVTGFRSFIGLIDTSGTAFGSDSLPAALTLAAFDITSGEFQDANDPNTAVIRYSIDTLVVPEPASLSLLALGLGLLASRLRRGRRISAARSPRC